MNRYDYLVLPHSFVIYSKPMYYCLFNYVYLSRYACQKSRGLDGAELQIFRSSACMALSSAHCHILLVQVEYTEGRKKTQHVQH